MNRRDILRSIAWAGAASSMGALNRSVLAQDLPPYQVVGAGPTLIFMSRSSPGVTEGYLERLTDDYRVVVVDYPFDGDEAESVAELFTPDYVCHGILGVADASGAERFAFFGYSWGGTVALQLAARTDRLTAVICGGWPPLGAPYEGMTREGTANAEQTGRPALFETYYRELENWPEREAVSGFSCPRMAFAGAEDVITTDQVTARIGPLIAEHKEELESLGWTVRLLEGFRHELGDRPDVVVPLIREFLDPMLLGTA